MTRVLSELLDAREPMFSQGLRQLESLAGHPRADIRLSSNLEQAVREKLRQLGLDGADTTGRELYEVLGARLKDDEVQFAAALQGAATVAPDPNANIVRVLQQHVQPLQSYAMKSIVAKRLLKANLPKKTMKALGYRSADSMLKHETAASLYAAAWLIESDTWTKRIVSAYAKLQAADFEPRTIAIEHPSSKRWQAIAENVITIKKQTVLSFKELGAVVLLPLPGKRPELSTLTTTVLTLRALNEIRAAGTFLKLHQMRSNFGTVVQQVVAGEPMLPAETLDEPVSWHSLHQYFSRFGEQTRADMFEPVVAAEELVWTSVEQVVARIAPALAFWEQTAHLAMRDIRSVGNRPVSCNLTDLLLSHCNKLPYEKRLVHHFQESLRNELLLNYLNHDKLEQTFFAGVHGRLAPEMAMI